MAPADTAVAPRATASGAITLTPFMITEKTSGLECMGPVFVVEESLNGTKDNKGWRNASRE